MKHQRGRKYIYIYIYIEIYIKKRIYVCIYQGVIFNVGDVAYLLGNLNERFLQKQKRDKEREKNACIKHIFMTFLHKTSCPLSSKL